MLYKVVDNYGTRRYEWTLSRAKQWLPYCGTVAVIGSTITRKVLVTRIQREA